MNQSIQAVVQDHRGLFATIGTALLILVGLSAWIKTIRSDGLRAARIRAIG